MGNAGFRTSLHRHPGFFQQVQVDSGRMTIVEYADKTFQPIKVYELPGSNVLACDQVVIPQGAWHELRFHEDTYFEEVYFGRPGDVFPDFHQIAFK